MKTKIIPFDIELAKKIQAGKIEGRIVTQDNEPVRIVCFDKKSTNKQEKYQVVALVEINGHEFLIICGENGLCWDCEYDCNRSLHIELPEEAPEEQHPIEESELYQAGYKVGFEAGRCVAFDEKKGCTIKKEASKYDDVEEVPTGDGSIVFLRHKKYEFKPFDKVLVRYPDKTELCAPNSAWLPGIFQYKSVNSNLYFISGKAYKDCIPYEGNEHLVGTTDKPKEE